MEYKVEEIDNANSKDSMSSFIDRFRVEASNNRNNEKILNTIDKAIKKCKYLNDQESLVKLYEIKVSQIEHLKEKQPDIIQLVQLMKEISEEINYMGGLALAYYKEWYIAKLKGEREKSLKALENSMDYVIQYLSSEEYEYHVCMYSFAIEKWLSEHNTASAEILKNCSNYFFKNGFKRSFIQTIFMLVIIYTRMHKGGEVLEACKRIFENKRFFDSLPRDVKAISYCFVGVGHMLDLNLNLTETYFEEAHDIFKPIYKESIYFGYFLVLQSYTITVKALQGKLEQTCGMINDIENLLQEEFFDKNLDSGTKKQIRHTLKLNKFYVYSRLKNFDTTKMQDLIKDILEGSKALYSDFMLLSEFILNANLKLVILKELLKTDNFSINRVKHLISFVLLGRNEKNRTKKNLEKKIEVLTNRETTSKTTFIENVLSDLLITQQLYSLRRYAEISVLLRKYENQLHRIEVLELRVFMEAFIQVGAYKNGDPLGPALQYMAIK
ncbi:MAG: hypothetical protein GOP50_09015, partial [Candidatus Heimdallarchaeota archaeon]|nr:hypothetical protein [Candidatus Heimdallarchaeota archaeon]